MTFPKFPLFLCLFLGISATIFAKERPLKLEAHRGAGHLAPENTLEAFRKAIEIGVDGIETDVWLTSDKVPVLIHGMLEPFAGYAEFKFGYANVSTQTLDTLKRWRLRNGEKIITLAEALDVCKGKIDVNIELKDFREEVVERILDIVEEKGMLEQVSFSSFHHNLRKKLTEETERRNIAPMSFGYLSHAYNPKFPNYRHTQPGDSINFDIRYLQQYRRASLTQIYAGKAKGVISKIWFPMGYENEMMLYQDLVDIGVDAIITNQPDLAVNFFDNEVAPRRMIE